MIIGDPCYHHTCRNTAAYRVVATHRPWWRRALNLPHQVWLACAAHRHEPGAYAARHRAVTDD